jgi:LytS/YehU family sensor histidine kinase
MKRLHVWFIAGVLVVQVLGFLLLRGAGFPFTNPQAVVPDMLLFIGCIYLGRWLCGRWYLRRQFVLFGVYTLLTAIGISLVKWLMIRYVAGHPYAGYLEAVRDTVPFFWAGLLLGMILKLIRTQLQREAQEARIKAEQKESEFRLLQSQLSPHFLFNVLNNLYGLSISEPGRMPELLLKLSQLLRYSVYGGRNTWVSLKDEVSYIRNYIEFERLRISDRLSLELQLEEVTDPSIHIAPMILLVFVENAFKHARNNLDQRIFVSISLAVSDGHIRFRVSNSYRPESHAAPPLPEESGLGVSNTLQRLELLYGDNYDLKRKAEKDHYFVELNLKLKDG